MAPYDDEDLIFGNRRIFIMLLLYKTLGLNSTLNIPQYALSHGALGCLIIYSLTLILIGIPIVYMELIISQFTNRNCIDVWKIRPCLSHFGYVVFFWQFLILLYNHVFMTLIVHYLIVSFGTPPPYTVCGSWAGSDCDILKVNYTLNQLCIREKLELSMCKNLYTTYPEYQYYTRHLLERSKFGISIHWPIILSSGVTLLLMYFNCFKMITSIKWSIYPMTLYPLVGLLVIMMGSLRQKGLVQKFAAAMDVQFQDFTDKMEVGSLVHQAVHSMGVGTGFFGNLAACAPFRSPCYANSVIAVLACVVFTAISICIAAMMVCPYALVYGVEPERVINFHMSFTFIKIPKLLSEYENTKFWLLLTYSFLCVTGISSNVVLLFSLLLTVTDKSDKLKRYPAIVSFFIVCFIFLITLPLLGPFSKKIMNMHFRRSVFLTTIFFAMCENVVFVMTYGFGRFYEDIHFMQGIPPKNFMKVSWVMVIVTLVYIFFNELISVLLSKKSSSDLLGLYTMTSIVGTTLLVLIGKLLAAALRRKFKEAFALDPTWGPVNNILKRSRAMFTAHAMTKEYMYRQYHLQAGVVARQQRSNVRVSDGGVPGNTLECPNILHI